MDIVDLQDPWQLHATAGTHVGFRINNEDAHLTSPSLVVVADGMGGHAAGEVASALAVSALERTFAADPTREGLASAVRAAHQEVRQAAAGSKDLAGMGTTLCAFALTDDGPALVSVGDSRAYGIVCGHAICLTADDTVVAEAVRDGWLSVEQARVHPCRNRLTQAVGGHGELTVEVVATQAWPSRLLLCTDGVHDVLNDAAIGRLAAADNSRAQVCQQIIDAALDSGARDNITVAVIDVHRGPCPTPTPPC